MTNQSEKEEIAELKRVWNSYGWPALMAIFIVIAVGFGWSWYQKRQQNQIQQQEMALDTLATSITALSTQFESVKDQRETVKVAKSQLAQAKKNKAEADKIAQLQKKVTDNTNRFKKLNGMLDAGRNDFTSQAQGFLASKPDELNVIMTHWLLAKYYVDFANDDVAQQNANYQKAIEQFAAVYNDKKALPSLRQISRLRASRIMLSLKQYDQALALLKQEQDNSKAFKKVTQAYIDHVNALKKS